MFCTRCGLRIEEGARFCPSCGQSVEVSIPVPTSPAGASVGAPVGSVVYAGFWLRVVAHIIDQLILGIPLFIVMLVLIMLAGGFRIMARRGEIGAPDAAFVGGFILTILLGIAILVVAQWLYFAAMESSARQATFGKAAMSLRATDLEGGQLTFKHATGRFFAKIITGLIPLGIGYIMAGFTEKKQALHDMIAGTLVLRRL